MDLHISIYLCGELKGMKTVSTPCIIGRSKEANLTVGHPNVSRKHCELFEDSGKLYLRDLGSLNGTFYKGIYVEVPVEFPLDDEFSLGSGLVVRMSRPSTPLTSEQQRAASDSAHGFMLEQFPNQEDGCDPIMQTLGATPEPIDLAKIEE